MEAINKEHNLTEQIEAEIESSAQEKESAERVKVQELQGTGSAPSKAAQNELDGEVKLQQEPPKQVRGKGRPRKKCNILVNLRNLASKDGIEAPSRSPIQYKIPEPEQWESRLRQSGRQSVLNKIKTVSKELLNAEAQDRSEMVKKRAEKLAQQNASLEITFVKVEGDVGILDKQIDQSPQQNGISEVGFVKVEADDQFKSECKERFYEQSGFNEFSVVEVNDNRQCVKDEGHTSALTRNKLLQTQRRRLRQNNYYKKRRANETLVERLRRLERARIKRRQRFESETEEGRRRRLEGLKRSRNRKRNRARGRRNPPPENENLFLEAVSSTQVPATTRDKEIKVDTFGCLLGAICRTQHSHHLQQQRLQNFGSLSTSFTYILAAVAWHKLNRPADKEIDESLEQSDPHRRAISSSSSLNTYRM